VIGAGLENDAASTITSSTIWGNTASFYGGGLFNSFNSCERDDYQQHNLRKFDRLRGGRRYL
jgi:hypothetical protein